MNIGGQLGKSIGVSVGENIDDAALLGAPLVWFDPRASGMGDGVAISAYTSRVNGYVVAQGTAGNRPVMDSDGLNGFPGLHFTGASLHRLISADGTLAGILDGSQAYTTYWVASFASHGGTIWSCGSTTANHRVDSGTSGAGVDRGGRRAGGSADTDDGTIVIATNTPTLITQVYTGSAYQSWNNGVASLASGANVLTPTCDRFCLGVMIQSGSFNTHLNGWIGDVLIYLGVHSAGVRTGIEGFLRRKYAL